MRIKENHMKRVFIAQFVVIVLIVTSLLVGCTTKVVMPAPTIPLVPATTTTITIPPTTTSPFVWTDSLFLDFVRKTYPSQKYVDDNTILALVHGVCDYLREGNSTNDVAALIASAQVDNNLSDATTKDMAEVIGGGITAFCPELRDNSVIS